MILVRIKKRLRDGEDWIILVKTVVFPSMTKEGLHYE